MRDIAEVLRIIVDRLEDGSITREKVEDMLEEVIQKIIDLPSVGGENGII